MRRSRLAIAGVACLALVGLAVAVAATLTSGGSAPERWSAPERIPVPASAVSFAQAGLDPAGRAHVAWVERRGGLWSLMEIERDPRGEWSAPRAIVRDRPFAISISAIAANARGDAAALWGYAGDRRGVLVASARPLGGAWEPEQAVSRVRAGFFDGHIAVAPEGAVTVVGRGLAGPGLWAVRRGGPGAWQEPVRLSPEGLGVDAPALSQAPDGRLAVAALLTRPGRPRTAWTVVATPAGRWGAPRAIPGSQGARIPMVALTREGGAVAAWMREDRARGTSRAMAASRSATGPWRAPVVLDDAAPPGPTPPTARSHSGGAVVSWTRWDGRPEDRRTQVWAADGGDPRRATLVAAPVLAPVSSAPGSTVVYTSPPLQALAGEGPTPILAWTQTGGGGARLMVAGRRGGSWDAPVAVGGGGTRGVYPVAVGSAADSEAVIWSEAPPGSPANALLFAER